MHRSQQQSGNAFESGSSRAPRRLAALAVAAALGFAAHAAQAAGEGGGVKAEEELERLERHEAEPGLYERQHLTGGWGGVRDELTARGVNLGFEYIGEVFSNVSGGLRTGAAYLGRFEMASELDLEKLMGWQGGTIFANAYQIHGRGLNPEHLGSLMPTSNIEADPATRLFDLWLQQSFWGDRASLRLGQLAADDEFIISAAAGNFLNGTFGWLALGANNLPNGGPAYPLAAPGVRLEAMPAENLTVRTAAFSGDPAGRSGENPNGTKFSFEGGVFWITELQYDTEIGAAGLPGTYKIGGWYHSGSLDDLRYDTNGISLASPASNGVPARHRGSYAIYGVADQMVYREADDESQGLTLFTRIGAGPSDVYPVDFYADGGATYTGPIPGRGEDVAGIAVAYAGVSSALRGLDEDARMFSGMNTPVEDYEIVVELLYSAQIAPWWLLQSDVQFIIHPRGNVADPNDPTGLSAVPDACVLGLRSSFTF